MMDQNSPNPLRAIAHKAMLDRGLEPDFPANALQQLNGTTLPDITVNRACRNAVLPENPFRIGGFVLGPSRRGITLGRVYARFESGN